MKARDLMTTSIISVPPDMPVRRIAETLLDHGISAVPVVDGQVPVGVVSEGDVVSRCCEKSHSRRDWFVRMVAGNGEVKELVSCAESARTARDIMSAPVITTTEDQDARQICRLMLTHRIKRIPVVRGGRIVGIVSRADLMRAMATQAPDQETHHHERSALGEIFMRIDQVFHHHDRHGEGKDNGSGHGEAASPRLVEPGQVFTAEELKALVIHHKQDEVKAREEERRQRRTQSKRDVEVLLAAHLTEDMWRHILLDAHHAAERGEKEMQLLRMPREACTDNGRMIGVGEAEWPSTLRGEAAEIWQRWRRELKDRGFRITARTLEYPDGIPGDIGLFLVWGGSD